MKCDNARERGLRKSSIEPAPGVLTILSCLLHVAAVAARATCDGLSLVEWVRSIASASVPSLDWRGQTCSVARRTHRATVSVDELVGWRWLYLGVGVLVELEHQPVIGQPFLCAPCRESWRSSPFSWQYRGRQSRPRPSSILLFGRECRHRSQ